MHKLGMVVFSLILSGLGTATGVAAPNTVDQARTMDDVIGRVIINENRANQRIRQYSPLVETYMPNLS